MLPFLANKDEYIFRRSILQVDLSDVVTRFQLSHFQFSSSSASYCVHSFFMFPVYSDSGGLRGSRFGSAPPIGRRNNAVTHGTPDVTTILYYGDSIASLYLFKHVKMVFKMIATSGFLTALECTKFVFGPARTPLGSNSALQTS